MPKIHILNFHGIGSPSNQIDRAELPVWVTTELFTEIVAETAPRDDVEYTFDDGNVSDYEIAFPVLAEHSRQAIFFVVTDRIDQPDYLSRTQIREMAEHGMIIGSHGQKHIPWRGLSPEALHAEVETSKKDLEDLLGRPVLHAACPFGSYDRKVLTALRNAEYDFVYTSDRGPTKRKNWLQSRNTIHDDDTITSVRQILSPSGLLRSVIRKIKLCVKQIR